MKTINQLKTEHQDRLTVIFKKFGVIFAFSKKQFDEQKEDGVDYVHAGFGMLIQKTKKDGFLEEFNKYEAKCEQDFKNEITVESYIEYELANHECYYTGEWLDALDAVRLYYPDVSADDVRKVYLSVLKAEEK